MIAIIFLWMSSKQKISIIFKRAMLAILFFNVLVVIGMIR
jgi:hypothetical protein